MRTLFAMVICGAGIVTGMCGCASTGETMRVPADTQPCSYMNDVTNPQNQPQLEHTGSIRY